MRRMGFESVLKGLRDEWREAAQRVQPSKQFGAELLLGIIALHLEAREVTQAQNIQQRKERMHEFKRHRETVTKAIQVLRSRETVPTQDLESRALP